MAKTETEEILEIETRKLIIRVDKDNDLFPLQNLSFIVIQLRNTLKRLFKSTRSLDRLDICFTLLSSLSEINLVKYLYSIPLFSYCKDNSFIVYSFQRNNTTHQKSVACCLKFSLLLDFSIVNSSCVISSIYNLHIAFTAL